jgi:hypothetical protein
VRPNFGLHEGGFFVIIIIRGGQCLGNEISPSLPRSGTGGAMMSEYEKDNRTATRVDSFVSFYEDGKFVGSIDYSDKSDYYIRDACENWISGIMARSTVVYYSELSQQMDFDFDTYGGGIEHWGSKGE